MTFSRNPRSSIHGRSFALLSLPKVGAVCLYGGRVVKGVAQGSYSFFFPSVSLFDLGSPFLRPDPAGPIGRRAQERSRLGPRLRRPTAGLGLAG
jgi:hypothetical protein